MASTSVKADFGLKIDFAKGTENPARVFRSLDRLIDFCQETDKTLIKYLDLDFEPTLLLEDIEQGSITVWLKIVFDYLQDSQLEKPSFLHLNTYLINAKLCCIKFLENKKTIKTKSEFVSLDNKLIELAEKTPDSQIRIHKRPTNQDLITIIDEFSSATSELQSADKLYYLTRQSNEVITTKINTNFSLSQNLRKIKRK